MVRMILFIAAASAIVVAGNTAFAENPVRSFDRAVSDLLKEPTKAGNKVGRKASEAVNKTADDVEKGVSKAVKGKKKNKDREGK